MNVINVILAFIYFFFAVAILKFGLSVTTPLLSLTSGALYWTLTVMIIMFWFVLMFMIPYNLINRKQTLSESL